MSADFTLNLNENVFYAAEELAHRKGISVDALTEMLLKKAAASAYQTIDELPVADWVLQLSEGPVEATPDSKSWKELKEEYYESKK